VHFWRMGSADRSPTAGIMLGILQDGFTLQGINAFTFDIVIGAAILIAMVANIHLARLRGGGPA
jgi:simple sugar transport system permease protein